MLPSEDEMADCPPQLAAHTTPDELLSDRGWAEPLVGQLGFAREGARPNNASSDMHAADRTPGALPRALTPLIGREREIAAAERLVRDGQRLLTLTGPGGVGKTRLSLAVASATADLFPSGTVFVSLAPILDPALVPPVVAAALGVPDPDTSHVVAALTTSIGDRRVLLVLDNFEHLLEAATLIPTLLVACTRLCVLVTSRSPLQVVGEYLLPVPTLGLPDGNRRDDLDRSEAVQLLLARARATCGEFELTDDNAASLLEISRKLDGLPLAIELAAPRLRMLTPSALLERLDRGLGLLSGGARDAPPRLRTLRDAIAWSYALLAPPQQALLRRLGIFAGGWSLEAVGPCVFRTCPSLMHSKVSRRCSIRA